MADQPDKPDLRKGVPIAALRDGEMLLGHVDDEDVLVARAGNEIFAVGAACTHYHGPLADGIVVGDTVRCPWHHACFSLRTGEAVRPPALDPIACWRVERQGDLAIVRDKLSESRPARAKPTGAPASVVIIGGGAAGLAAADMLRREAYDGPITMISADDAPPVDRPTLAKASLAGTARGDWIPLRSPEFYPDKGIGLRLGARVSSMDAPRRELVLGDG